MWRACVKAYNKNKGCQNNCQSVCCGLCAIVAVVGILVFTIVLLFSIGGPICHYISGTWDVYVSDKTCECLNDDSCGPIWGFRCTSNGSWVRNVLKLGPDNILQKGVVKEQLEKELKYHQHLSKREDFDEFIEESKKRIDKLRDELKTFQRDPTKEICDLDVKIATGSAFIIATLLIILAITLIIYIPLIIINKYTTIRASLFHCYIWLRDIKTILSGKTL